MKKKIAVLLVICLMAALFTGCDKHTVSDDKLNIVTSIFPIYDWTVNLTDGAENVNVSMLVRNGTDLHSYQPSAADLVTISECDVFIYVGGESDDWATETIENYAKDGCLVINLMQVLGNNAKYEETIEGMTGEADTGDYDEHVWLSVANAMTFVRSIASGLESKDSANASVYKKNLEKYIEKLIDLDTAYSAAVNASKIRTLLFADRFPFRYLADEYLLDYYAAFSGCSAEAEASFETVVFLAGKIDELGLPAVLIIDGSDGKLAETVVSNTTSKDAQILTLNSMQTVSSADVKKGATYIGIMEDNLEVLKTALGSGTSSEKTPTPAVTDSGENKPTASAGLTPTEPAVTGSISATDTPAPGITGTAAPTGTETVTPTGSEAPTEAATPTGTEAPTETTAPANTATPTDTPAPTSTLTPTDTPVPTATATNTPTPKPTATNTPTPKPTATNTPTPKPTATNTPTPKPTATPTPASAAVNITDSNLEKAVRSAIGKSSGTITENDVKSVTTLDLKNMGISSLNGLASFTSLKTLYIDSNSISDLSPLKNLKSLETLTAGYNSISSISALSGLTNLTVLALNNNQITDISTVASLTKLTELDLSYNTLSSIKAVSGLSALKILRLTSVGISDLSPLSSIAGGLDSLWLGFNSNITSISALSGMKSTATLNLAGDKNISDWSPVAHVTNVTGRP